MKDKKGILNTYHCLVSNGNEHTCLLIYLYLEAKPECNIRRIKELSTKVQDYETLLNEIGNLPGSPSKRIRDLLHKVWDPRRKGCIGTYVLSNF